MALFLTFGTLSCSLVIFIYLLEKSVDPESEIPDFRIISFMEVLHIIVYKPVFKLLPYFLVFTICLIYAIIVVAQRISNDPINSVYDYLTSREAARSILGLIFGVLLAAWIISLLRSREKEAFSLSQRAAGVALACLFVLGTTSISVEDLLRGVKIGSGGVGFDLPSPSNAQTKGSDFVATIGSPPVQSEGADPVDRRWGMETLTNLHASIERDARIEFDEASLQTDAPCNDVENAPITSPYTSERTLRRVAAIGYRCKFSPIAACLSAVVAATRDESYLLSALAELRPPIRELHLSSLAQRATKVVLDTESTDRRIRDRLDYLSGLLREHTGSISPGLEVVYGKQSDLVLNKIGQCKNMPANFTEYRIRQIGFEDRPYLTILYAALLQLGNQELAAVDAIDDWMKVNSPARGSAYYFRARLSQFQILERFFRRVPDQNDTVVERFVAISDDLMDSIRMMTGVKDSYKKMFNENKYVLIASEFGSLHPVDAGACNVTNQDQLALGFTLYNVQVISSRRAMQHTRFEDKYYRAVTDIITQAVEADPSCLYRLFGRVNGAVTQAETLVVYARFKAKVATSRKPLGPRYDELVASDLEGAQSVLEMARNIVEKERALEQSARNQLPAAGSDQDLINSVNALSAEYKTYLDRIRR